MVSSKQYSQNQLRLHNNPYCIFKRFLHVPQKMFRKESECETTFGLLMGGPVRDRMVVGFTNTYAINAYYH